MYEFPSTFFFSKIPLRLKIPIFVDPWYLLTGRQNMKRAWRSARCKAASQARSDGRVWTIIDELG